MVMSTKKIVRGVGESIKGLEDIKTPMPEMKDAGAELKAAVAPKNDLSFAEKFKANRMAGNKTFTYNGKTYTTKMAGEGTAPARRPAAAKPATAPTSATPAKPATAPRSATPAKPAATTAAPARVAPKTPPKRDNTAAGRRERMGKVFASLNPFRDTSAREKEIAKAASKPRDYAADRARMKAEKLAEKAARRKELGIREPKMAKGGSIDGAAIRGKTRAMKKGK